MNRTRQIVTITMLFVCVLQIKIQAQVQFTNLVWSDEFNYEGKPDSTKWSYDKGNGCPDICGWGNKELQYYTNRESNAQVTNGKLILTAARELYEGMNYTSARILSKGKGDWRYGRFEIKAKLPAGKGMWPAIWMLPTKWEYGGWPHSGEIDIMENVGYWPDSLLSSIHTGAYNGMINTQKTQGVNYNDLSKTFHVYGMVWTENKIEFFIDGRVYHVFENDHTNSAAWPFDKTFHLLMNVAVGGNWGGKYGVDDSIFPQQLEIDYVRVYQ